MNQVLLRIMANKNSKDGRKLRLAQLNMQRSQCVTLEIARIMNEKNIDILFMQEPRKIHRVWAVCARGFWRQT